jgi:hypothetical protein
VFFNMSKNNGAPRFDRTSTTQAKSLVIVMVPVFALLVAPLEWRRRTHVVQDVVFALHAMAVMLVAMIGAALVPSAWIATGDAAFFNSQRLLLLFWSSMVCAGFTAFGWFAFFGQFSRQAWNSRYFN